MKCVPYSFGLGPEPKFLGESAIAGHCPLAKGEATILSGAFQAADHCLDFFRTDAKEVFEELTILRGIRMKRKGSPFNRYVIFFL
jgi:hypothetical protein